MPLHICPVCRAPHEVSSDVHRFAYGRQLTCSPICKARFARQVRQHILDELARRWSKVSKE